jgi:hypothetical protein
MANYWLKECLSKHAECSKPAERGFLPTRVIDVGSENDATVALCETKSFDIPQEGRRFIALSHCWGKARLLTTTLETLDERLAGISLSSLPPVFRDAVIATRKLGVKYIWIDSLCIVQDSKSDWEAESVQMCQIYQSAVLTIASAHSSDSQGGLFATRDGYRVVPFEVEVQLLGQGTTAQKIFRFVPTPKREIMWDLRDLPLYTRAWCFQELVLAPRTLIFDPDDIKWECLSHHGSERSPTGGISRHHNAVKAVQQALSGASEDGQDSFSKFGPDIATQSNVWQHMVEDYTARKLTKDTDRLIAIAGIADGLQSHSSKQYVAGLWKDQLPITLLWFVRTYFDPPNEDEVLRSQLPDRPSEMIAPSWSWASCSAPVFHNPHIFSKPMCEVRSAITSGTPHRQSGTLTIYGDTRTFYVCSESKAVIKEAVKLNKSESYRFKGQYNLVQSLIRADALIFVATPTRKWKYHVEAVPGIWQPEEKISEDTLVTFIAVARSELRDSARSYELRRPSVYTIALISTNKPGQYRRVGYAEWHDCTWFGYECSEDYQDKKDCWNRLGKSWNRIKPPELVPGEKHQHPINHDPFANLSVSYHSTAAVKRCELAIV